jgi:hypothetical protein
MEHYLAHISDCEIVRSFKGREGVVAVVDCDGDVVFSVSNQWTDEQILIAFNIANKSYSEGFKAGENNKAYEIKKVLGIEK